MSKLAQLKFLKTHDKRHKKKPLVGINQQEARVILTLTTSSRSRDRVDYLSLDRLLLRLALSFGRAEFVSFGEELSERTDKVSLLGDGGFLVTDSQRASSVVVPLSSHCEHNRTDLRTDRLDLLEDALLGLAVCRDTVYKGGKVIRSISLRQVSF